MRTVRLLRSILPIGIIVLASCLALPAMARAAAGVNGRFANSGENGRNCISGPRPGLVIDAHNVTDYQCLLPWAAIEAVRHGFKIRIAGTHKIDWPSGYKQASEKYGYQVRLDDNDNLANYVAGMPFPLVNITDPKAARKIAYNWHMGPFMPDDFSLSPWGSFGYSDSADLTSRPIHSEPEYTDLCDQFSFLRFAHRTELDPRPTLGDNPLGIEWKARCRNWSAMAESDAGSIWTRFLDPRHADEAYVLNGRRLRRIAVFPYLDHTWRSCHQPYWAYALPKTEAFTYRLLGTTPILACMTASDEPAGFVGRSDVSEADSLDTKDQVAFSEEPFEMRSAYIIEMLPTDLHFANLRTLVWIDTETYVWLGAEFFESNQDTELVELQEVAAPLWHIHPAPEGGSLFELAGSFYMPLAYEPPLTAHSEAAHFTESPGHLWFLRSLVPSHGSFDQRINVGTIDEAIFNPSALGN
jgi:hypothetical protein